MKLRNPLVSAALLAFCFVLLASVAAAFRGGEPPRGGLTLPPSLPREWRFEPKPLDLDFMYHKPERPPRKLEDMYAKRRLSP